jgi:hypothetical protein
MKYNWPRKHAERKKEKGVGKRGQSHCCPTYSLSLRERVGEREKIELTAYFTPSPWPSPCGRGDVLSVLL